MTDINAPSLVLVAAGLSAIARGGIVAHPNPSNEGPAYTQVETLRFWTSIIAAAGGIILIDQFSPDIAKGFAALWIVGGIVINGPTLAKWLSGFGKGLSGLSGGK